MQSPRTRDGKVRAEQVSIPSGVGSITALLVKDNQFVKRDILFRIDDTPYHIAILNAQAQLAKAQSDLAKANNARANRRRRLSQNYISAEDLDTANITVKAMRASVNVAEATLKQAQWELTQTVITAPVDGWVTNLSARVGNYATTGTTRFASSTATRSTWWAILKRPKLRHIREDRLPPLRFTAARRS